MNLANKWPATAIQCNNKTSPWIQIIVAIRSWLLISPRCTQIWIIRVVFLGRISTTSCVCHGQQRCPALCWARGQLGTRVWQEGHQKEGKCSCRVITKSTNKRKHMPSSKSVEASKLTFRTISGRDLSISSLQMEKNTTMSRMTIVLNNPMTQLNPFMVKAKLLTKIKIANRSARKWWRKSWTNFYRSRFGKPQQIWEKM